MDLNNLIALGDSHVDLFKSVTDKVCKVGGATAYGISNVHSRTDSRNTFTLFLNICPSSTPIISLGEVDCNALIWKIDVNYLPYLKMAVRNYMSFLDLFDREFIVSSVILPAVFSYQSKEYQLRYGSRRNISACLQTRINTVNLFNSMLESRCNNSIHHFLDITSDTKSPNGSLNMKFAKSPIDPHLDVNLMAPIIRKKLDEIISNN
jgi:hypothetical protein